MSFEPSSGRHVFSARERNEADRAEAASAGAATDASNRVDAP
jgi:hypothetical protein